MKRLLILSVVLAITVATSAGITITNHLRLRYYTADSILTVYKSDNLIIRKLSRNVYEHTSFLNTNTFGRVSCNGMIVSNKQEAVVFDTPSTNSDSEELLRFLINDLKLQVKAIVATHFHADCLGGLDSFHAMGVKSYANVKTIALAKSVNATIPQKSFKDHFSFKVGNKSVHVEFLGEGHTRDNVVAYFPDDKILFGGCLVKELNASKGNLADANVNAWPETIRKVYDKYPNTQIVIPGHGEIGGLELLDYTRKLFK
ncbi:subclass B1 metallo-beta-lactamase [Daejeonella lutea]|uniref:beta-lactamase n=1 Tax=Daejeonella lutea TaxID=572036 RepID=A0A1T5B7A0_9SPHI|nr:subclass B1 metallo-beta-lactamase [Daejeonella lutea]SKB43151.1 metallo-beta-lactamase class B [Daejeonella lutea]